MITAQGTGAALSTSLAGLVVVHAGYSAACLVLAGIAASGFLLYFFGIRNTRPRRKGTGPNRNGGSNPMSPASFDLRTLATVVIFVATYAGVALGRVPGLRIDRAGIAFVGASLMIAFGTLSLEEAFKAIDLDAIALLLGMMIIVAQLRVSGFFELANGFAIRRAHGPPVLLTAIVIVTGFFSAFLVNDAICLVMAPLVIEVTRALRRNPVPYLLAVAMASNAGGAATFTGNPQNMARPGGGGRWC